MNDTNAISPYPQYCQDFYRIAYEKRRYEEMCFSKHNHGQLTLSQIIDKREEIDCAAATGFNWAIKFPAALWRQLSPLTKLLLLANDFVFPLGLDTPYSGCHIYAYCQDDTGRSFIIDSITPIEANGLCDLRFGQNLDTKEFFVFNEPGEFRGGDRYIRGEVLAISTQAL